MSGLCLINARNMFSMVVEIPQPPIISIYKSRFPFVCDPSHFIETSFNISFFNKLYKVKVEKTKQ